MKSFGAAKHFKLGLEPGTLTTCLLFLDHILEEWAVLLETLSMHARHLQLSFRLELEVLITEEISESPLLGHEDLHASRELEGGTTDRLAHVALDTITRSDGHHNLPNGKTGNLSEGLSESTSHTGLKSISTGTGQHLVDSQHVPRVDADTKMEGILSALGCHVLVDDNSGSFESFAGKMFLLVTHKVHGEGEVINISTLSADIVNLQLRVGNTTTEARPDVGLVLNVAIAASRS